MTLSLFPSLFSWSLLAPLLMRLALGSVFLFWSYKKFRGASASSQEKAVAILEALCGALIFVGLWTQAAALVAIVDLLVRIVGKITQKQFLTDGVNYYAILLVLAISLLVTGAGFLAIDLPL
jgi:uncharacterized membrane protein YphA (DoxX/SURF4 family)